MNIHGTHTRTVWLEGHHVCMIDQPLLPHQVETHRCLAWEQTADAIRDMRIRGAGAIGATAGYGMAQAALMARDAYFRGDLQLAADGLRHTRPTAQNLFWAIDQVLSAALGAATPSEGRLAAVAAAEAIADGDARACRLIGQHGAHLIADGTRVATHCNAGWLAFVDWGSALSPIYTAHRAGRKVHVWVDETRPRRQGARLTAFELGQEGVPHQVIPDVALGHLMANGQVDLVIVGADRIAANGDVANKIGTYMVALAAQAHGVPMYVAAPTTTIDPDCPDGSHIPIEHRSPDEVHLVDGWSIDHQSPCTVRTTPQGSPALNPAFDVTPAHLLAGIITEHGIVQATASALAALPRPTA